MRRVNATSPLNTAYTETAIAANPFNAMEVVALANQIELISGQTTGTGVYFGVSNDGGATFSNSGLFGTAQPYPPCANGTSYPGDPIAVASPRTGIIWFGAVFGGVGAGRGVFLASKSPGAGGLGTTVDVTCSSSGGFGNFDKPWLAVSPRTDGIPGDALYAFFEASQDGAGCPGNHPMYARVSLNSPTHPAGYQ